MPPKLRPVIASHVSLRFAESCNEPSCARMQDLQGKLGIFEDFANRDTLATTMDKPKILTAKELSAIMPRLAGWKLAQSKLSRTFEFQDFVRSLSFVNSLVATSRRCTITTMCVSHHDVRIASCEVTFDLTRYDVGAKVTDRNVEVAKKISSVCRTRL